jgi:pimeloyl-ACP methyl ester carboxylesterase
LSKKSNKLEQQTLIISADDGAQIQVETRGQGPVILFVHGWTVSSRFWQKQVAGLSDKYQVVTMDLRGHGASTKTVFGHTIVQYARDVESVLATLGLENVLLVGWSLAVPVVLSYWQQFGKRRLRALGLVDGTPFPFSPESWNAHGLRGYNTSGMNTTFVCARKDRMALATKFVHHMFHSGIAPDDDFDWMTKDHLNTPLAIANEIYADYLNTDCTEILPTIDVPTIVYNGNSGIFEKSIAMGEWVSSQIKNASFVPFEKGGHVLFYEQAEQFNHATDEFLKSIS